MKFLGRKLPQKQYSQILNVSSEITGFYEHYKVKPRIGDKMYHGFEIWEVEKLGQLHGELVIYISIKKAQVPNWAVFRK